MLIHKTGHRTRQSGMSLVELMVGIAVGMFVVAAASMLAATQLTDNRRLLLELQVQQDLRATADIITRDVRRIGVTGPTSINSSDFPVWGPTDGSSADMFYNDFTLPNSSEIAFKSTRQDGTTGPYGYKLVTDTAAGTGVIMARIPISITSSFEGWAPLTDGDAVRITSFQITQVDEPPIQMACPRLCPDPADPKGCWPTITVRSLAIAITAQSKSDPSIVREIRSVARLRNDLIDFRVDPTSSSSPACPL